jgi:hypothetical protein
LELDAESAAFSLGDVDGVAAAVADLIEHGLSRHAEDARGLVELDVADGHFGRESSSDLVGEADPPGAWVRSVVRGVGLR